MDRRDLVKWSLLGGGTALLAPRSLRTVLSYDRGRGGGGGGGDNDNDGANLPVSPATRAFISELPISPVKQPLVTPLDPPPVPAAHQRFAEFAPKKFYEIFIREALHRF